MIVQLPHTLYADTVKAPEDSGENWITTWVDVADHLNQ
jgi:hypothetical protein